MPWKAWNAALALPGALPDSRKGSEGWETGENQMLLFHMVAQIAVSKEPGHAQIWCKGWGGSRKRERKGDGLIPNTWHVCEQISASTVSGKLNSLSLKSSLKEYQIPNEYLPFSPQWSNIIKLNSHKRNRTNRSSTNNVLPHNSTEGRNLTEMVSSTFSNNCC